MASKSGRGNVEETAELVSNAAGAASRTPPSAAREPGEEEPTIGRQHRGSVTGAATRRRTMMSGMPPASALLGKVREVFRPSRSSFVWMVTIANTILFIVEMYENNCPQDKTESDDNQYTYIEDEANDRITEDTCVLESVLGRLAFEPVKVNPLFGPRTETFLNLGALYTPFIVEEREWWRLLSAIFLHGGLIHLTLNTVGIVHLGRHIHREFGFWRTGLIYVASGIGASLFSAVFIAGLISVGASGALFGLYGAVVADVIVNWSLTEKPLVTLVILLANAIVNLLIGLLPFVDNFAHIGGFIFGSLLGFLLLVKPVYHNSRERVQSTEICETFCDSSGDVRQASDGIEMRTLSASESNSGNSSTIIRVITNEIACDDSETKPINSETKRRKPKQVHQKCLIVTASVLLVVIPAILLSILISGADVFRFCRWCRHVNCIETDAWECSFGSVVKCKYNEDFCGSSNNCINPDCCHCNEAEIECSYTLKKNGGADLDCDYLNETIRVSDWTNEDEYLQPCDDACMAYTIQL